MTYQIKYLYALILGTALTSSTLLAQLEAPSTIYVGDGRTNGFPNGEYYKFFSDQGGTNPITLSEYVFYRGSPYTFERISDNGHPFYLSDVPNTNGSYHYGALSIDLNSTDDIGPSDGIRPAESFSFTIPDGYSNTLHYYCTVFSHTPMVAALSIIDAPAPPVYLSDPTRLVITEVDRGNNYVEVTNFGTESGVLEQTTVITSILGDSVTLPAGTAFSAGETKDEEFTSSFSTVDHLQLIALDAQNADFWVPAADDLGKGSFYDQQAITDPVPDVAQGSIAIGLQTVVSNLSHLIGMVDPDDDTGRLFIYEQTGTVQVLNQNGSIEPNPLMDVTAQLVPLTGLFGEDAIGYDERGLLGVALSPEFSTNGTLYYYASFALPNEETSPAVAIDFTFDSGVVIDHHSVVIERTFTDSNSNGYFDSNDTFTERELLRFEQPLAEFFPLIGSNHNGGHLAFDNSGYLMVSIGDGGDRDDTGNGHGIIGNGADPSNIWGTIIRIDPNGTNSANRQYGIPVDNPFFGDATKLAEIFAYGLRNPWTFSQDPVTGTIYTSDSGQDTIQEVNVVTPGGNYGWRAKEGSFLFDPISGTIGSLFNAPSISGHIDPIVEYDHDQGYANVIGGSVYRGSLLPELNGLYICGDYGPFGPAPGELFYVDTNGPDAQLKRFQIGVADRALSSDVRGFSVDAHGEIYFVGNSDGQSSLYKIVPLAHLSMVLTDQVEVTIIGDEGSQLSLQHSSELSTINSGTSTELTGSTSVFEYTLEEVGEELFFKVTAEATADATAE
jgi:glucose/arabinose dehydrogenase